MAEADRAINDILTVEQRQEEQSNRISHYERAKDRLKDALKKIDSDEQEAAAEMTAMYERYGIASWSFDSILEFRDRRNKAWSDYGSFLQKEKASLDQAKLNLREQQECAETLQKMQTADGYLDVAITEWLVVQPVQVPPEIPRTRSSVIIEPEEHAPEEPSKPKRLNVLGDIVDWAKRDMSEWKQKTSQRAKDRSSGKDADGYIETSRRKNNAIISLYHKVKEH